MLTLDLHKDVDADVAKEGYDVHDLSIQWTPKQVEDLTITAGLENIFDETYASHASYNNSINGYTDFEPGRTVKLTASYLF